MQLDNFDFQLPSELIANFPLEKRSASRLLQLKRHTDEINHHNFNDLPNLLRPTDLLIFNDTRVIPARLFGKKISGGKIEILIERILTANQVLAHIKSSKSLKPGAVINLENQIAVELITRHDNLWEIKFLSDYPVLEILNTIGHIPLPSYIKRMDAPSDRERYQTIFAKHHGAVAAPTAGLHFDEELLQRLRSKNIEMGFITLHVGAGTFQPVRVANILEHKMHAEYFEISAQTCEQINDCKKRNGRVIAVGTTVVRSLETGSKSGVIKPFKGETDIFIYPGYQFNCIDAMITNFHLPKSTLLMLVSAFAGRANILQAYQEAIKNNYRFYSYGDGMLIS